MVGLADAPGSPGNGTAETDPDRQRFYPPGNLPHAMGDLAENARGAIARLHRATPKTTDPPAAVPAGNLHLGSPNLDSHKKRFRDGHQPFIRDPNA
jgi:hypothetical protein